MALWRVVGGAGGALVRSRRELASQAQPERLAINAVVQELESEGERLHFKKLEGNGPDEGWVSVTVADQERGGRRKLLTKHKQTSPATAVPPLDSKIAAAVKAAAAIIHSADAILVGSGAGMGVDSGLGTFRGRNAGIWPPLKRLGLEFPEVSTPRWFHKDPHFAWAFWWFRYSAYTSCEPHRGYHLVSEWGRSKPAGFFSFTSNIDGHWELVGAPTYECHGTLRFLQCTRPCHDDCWPVGDDFKLELQEGSDERVRDPLPRCPKCGEVARPAVLMFGDGGYCSPRDDLQHADYGRFIDGLGSAKLAVIEVGAGTAVPTVRWTCEGMARRNGATLIRINMEDAATPPGGVSLELGALDALQAIDAELRTLKAAG